MKVFETPEGFEVVDTDAFLAKEDAVQCHLLLYSNQHDWWMGKIVNWKPRGTGAKSNSPKFNFELKWTEDHVEKLGRTIAEYYVPDKADVRPEPGNWFYLKKSTAASTTRNRTRRRDPDSDDDGPPTNRARTNSRPRRPRLHIGPDLHYHFLFTDPGGSAGGARRPRWTRFVAHDFWTSKITGNFQRAPSLRLRWRVGDDSEDRDDHGST